MPDLGFQITGVEPAERSLTPLLHFRLAISNTPETEAIHALMLQVQIQFETPRRAYNDQEKAKLLDLFGTPDQWGQTLRTRLWAHTAAMVGAFTGSTEAILPVICTYDLNVASAKYLYALEDGDVPLRFLFSGSIFYGAEGDRMQVQPISWDSECVYRMPIATWRQMMNMHFPNGGWIALEQAVLDRLYAYRRSSGLVNWEQTLEHLLAEVRAE